MSVKLIAVDMDGTFLSDEKTYNRALFLAQYARRAFALWSPAGISTTS